MPHPATYILDRDGVVRFLDVPEDSQVWVDPAEVLAALAKVPWRSFLLEGDMSSPGHEVPGSPAG